MRPLIVVFNGNSAPTGSMHTYKYVLYRCLRCDYLNKTHASRVCSTGVSLSGRTFEILFFFFLALATAAVVEIMADGEGKCPGSYLGINKYPYIGGGQ